MTKRHSPEQLIDLVHEFRGLPAETEWVEFKVDLAEPEEIGEYLSALSNSAALENRDFAYLLWGIENDTHRVVGTRFAPGSARVGNEDLENWLARLLQPRIDFRFEEASIEHHRVVVLSIGRAISQPVRFKGQEFIRIKSYKKKLKDFPEKERELWRIFDRAPFESGIAADGVDEDGILRLLDYPAYFQLSETPLPSSRERIIEALKVERLIQPDEGGRWNVTNLGACLFANQLEEFQSIWRKAVRVIQYPGASRVEAIREQVGVRGYANGFEGLIAFVNGLLPSNEVVQQALRKTVPVYPELAVRELVVNALIHQDFSAKGAGPMVEIFRNRMEITSPGVPLVETDRFLDSPPKSRNETLASLMRRLGICEERGSGVDKVVFQTELYQLPAPMFEAPPDSTRAILFAPQRLASMAKADRVRACYLHACLKYVNRSYLTNSTVRARFGIAPGNSATASRFIKEAVEEGVVQPYDPGAAPKLMKYVPWWAQSSPT